MVDCSEKLKSLRETRGMTQLQVANRIVTTGKKRYKGHRQRKVQTEGFFSRNASAKPRTIQWD